MAGLDDLTEYLLALYRNRETQPDRWRAALEALEDMSPVKVVDEVSLTRERPSQHGGPSPAHTGTRLLD